MQNEAAETIAELIAALEALLELTNYDGEMDDLETFTAAREAIKKARGE